MARANPIEFIRQVRGELKKVTWPTRKETMISTMAVFVMVFVAAVFLYTADQIMAWLVRTIVELGM